MFSFLFFFLFTLSKGSLSSLFFFFPNLHQPSEKGTKRKILDRMKSHQVFCGINEIFFFPPPHVLVFLGLFLNL